ncbi:MAG: hypothetical protein ACK4M3_01375 [Pyrobaculum sp.]
MKRKIKKLKILELAGRWIKIDKKLDKAGWLVFPKFGIAVGVFFYGDMGLLASTHVPSAKAYFIPLDVPIMELLPVDIEDFY